MGRTPSRPRCSAQLLPESPARGTRLPHRGQTPSPHGRRHRARGPADRDAFGRVARIAGDRPAGERIYYDRATVLQQLAVLSDPTSLKGRIGMLLLHPITILRAALGI